ncbi:hypothetical protein ACFX16_025768 [Malus domestica]
MMTVPWPPITIDERNRRWTAGARGNRTLETTQSGGGNVTSIQSKTTSLT